MYFQQIPRLSVLYFLMMGWTAIRIPRWVVTLSICIASSNPIFSVHARCSGVTKECLEFSTNLLTVPFLCAIFALALPLIMLLRAISFTLIADINRPSAVSATRESVINTKIRLLSWNMSLGLTLFLFLDIYTTHYFSLYGMFLYIVTFVGYHSASPSVKKIRAQVSNSWSDGT